MKKALFIFTLVLTIVTSLTAGTLATYTKTLTPVEGSVAAKVFHVENSETTIANVRLAPTESTQWTFFVVNYHDDVVTEVDMDLYITVNLGAKAGFDEIDGLTVGLFEGDKQYGSTIIRNGTIDIEIGRAFLANQKSTRKFTLKVLWENGLVSDETVTHNADDQHTSKIAVTVTGKQCTHVSHSDDPKDPPTNPSIGDVSVSSSNIVVNNQDMSLLTFNNFSTDIKNGWIIEFDTESDEPLDTIQDGTIYVTNQGVSSWNTVEFEKIGANRWRMKPVLDYYHNAVDLYKDGTLTVRFVCESENKDPNISNGIVKVPYVVSGIQANFKTDYTNFYVDLANLAENSRIYGWEIAFKTSVELNTSTINPYTLEKIYDDGTFKTYKIKTIVSNSGVLYLDSGETKRIIYITSVSPMNEDTVIVKDVTFFGNTIPYTVNGL